MTDEQDTQTMMAVFSNPEYRQYYDSLKAQGIPESYIKAQLRDSYMRNRAYEISKENGMSLGNVVNNLATARGDHGARFGKETDNIKQLLNAARTVGFDRDPRLKGYPFGRVM